VVADGGLRFQPIRVGATGLDGRVQVLEGVSAGDRVVVHAESELSARSRIRIVDSLPERAR
jgi:HlyD family secretion protein